MRAGVEVTFERVPSRVFDSVASAGSYQRCQITKAASRLCCVRGRPGCHLPRLRSERRRVGYRLVHQASMITSWAMPVSTV